MTDPFVGQLTFTRIYRGVLKSGTYVMNSTKMKKERIGRLLKMHAIKREEVSELYAGEIGAVVGLKTTITGDTLADMDDPVILERMDFPEPVISVAVEPKTKSDQEKMGVALGKLAQEDPSFRVETDEESGQTIISGMGELHLEVYIERMKREYAAEVEVGAPQVAYRETITQQADFNYTHIKQTGGSGQFGRVGGHMEPLVDEEYEFVDEIVGGVIPREYIPSCDKGFRASMEKGTLIGAAITGVKMTLNDGSFHAVDSSDMAFQQASKGAFREGFAKAGPVIMEPIMKVAVEGPSEFQGAVMGSLNQRRGMIVGTFEEGNYTVVEAEMPLSEMFGYSTTLRSLTQGKAEFTMEFATYKQVPKSVAEELIKAYQDQKKEA